jgi:hypothetical protein
MNQDRPGEVRAVAVDQAVLRPREDEGFRELVLRFLHHEADRGTVAPACRTWRVLRELGWHRGAALGVDERAHYQALWALADEADGAERRASRLGRRAARRGFFSGVLAAAAALLSGFAGVGTVSTLLGTQAAGWITLGAAVAASGSGAMQGVSRGLGSLRVEQRAWEQYAEVIADDVAVMVADGTLDSLGRGRWAAARLAQARREAPDYLARRAATGGL